MTPDLDLLVAGSGPAGLGTALYAARAGLRVAVADPRASPVDKACGEGLMPGAVAALTELLGPAAGGGLAGQPFRGIRYVGADGTAAQCDFPRGTGLGVRRTTLQAAMASACADAGVALLPARVASVEQDAAGVRAGGLTARYLVAADGLHSPVRALLGLGRPGPGRRAARYGLRRHFAVAPWSEHVEVHWSARAEAYVTPVATDLVGVAVLTGEHGSFEDHLRAFPALRERLPPTAATPTRGSGPLRQRVRARVCGRVLLVGDAAGYVDALTGEGIAVSLASARSLVGCVLRDRPEDYERAWRRDSRRYRLITESLLLASGQPHLRRALVPLARRLPWVFRTAVGQLAR